MWNTFTSSMKAAANFVQVETTKAYEDLTGYPTSVRCVHGTCNAITPVPASIWEWQCLEGHNNVGTAKKCATCNGTRPTTITPSVACCACSLLIPVPSTNAAKNTRDVQVDINRGYNELKSRPKSIKCLNEACLKEIEVPDDKWNWLCSQAHPNTRSAELCAQCGEKVPSSLPNPLVECAACGTGVTVSTTVGVQRMRSAGTEVKVASKQIYNEGKQEYTRLKSKPNEFNCRVCNTLLVCPPAQAWVCAREGCNQENEGGADKCVKCKKALTKEVLCGQCNNVTDIPSSNLSNSLRVFKLESQKMAKDTKDYIAKFGDGTTTTTTTTTTTSTSSSSEADAVGDYQPPTYDEPPAQMHAGAPIDADAPPKDI